MAVSKTAVIYSKMAEEMADLAINHEKAETGVASAARKARVNTSTLTHLMKEYRTASKGK